MSQWKDSRMVDLMTFVDPSVLEEDYPETDLETLSGVQSLKKSLNKKKIALVSGVAAAGSLALTGAVVWICRRHQIAHQMA
jgi:hypothetical protein